MPLPLKEEEEGQRFCIKIDYEREDQEEMIVNDCHVRQVQKQRFSFGATKDFLRSCLPYGAVVAALGATVYFLANKWLLLASPVVTNSVIFEVIRAERKQKEIAIEEIRKDLQEIFSDLTLNIERALKIKWKDTMTDEEYRKFKITRIISVTLCTQADMGTAVEKLEMEIARKSTVSKAAHEESRYCSLWNSDLRSTLYTICPQTYCEETALKFLLRCNDLGILNANNLERMGGEKMDDNFKGALKLMEIRKLEDFLLDRKTSIETEEGPSPKKPRVEYSN